MSRIDWTPAHTQALKRAVGSDSVRDFGKKCGVSYVTIHNLLKGESTSLRNTTWKKLGDWIDVSTIEKETREALAPLLAEVQSTASGLDPQRRTQLIKTIQSVLDLA